MQRMNAVAGPRLGGARPAADSRTATPGAAAGLLRFARNDGMAAHRRLARRESPPKLISREIDLGVAAAEGGGGMKAPSLRAQRSNPAVAQRAGPRRIVRRRQCSASRELAGKRWTPYASASKPRRTPPEDCFASLAMT